jgi:hypothetical protein
VHPVRPAPWWISIRAQAGNADDMLLRRRHGPAGGGRLRRGPAGRAGTRSSRAPHSFRWPPRRSAAVARRALPPPSWRYGWPLLVPLRPAASRPGPARGRRSPR